MNTLFKPSRVIYLYLFAFIFLAMPAQAAKNGELWEVTMEIGGASGAANKSGGKSDPMLDSLMGQMRSTSKMCAEKDKAPAEAAAPPDKSCKALSQQVTATSLKAQYHCTKPQTMDVTIDFARKKSAFTLKSTTVDVDGQMTIHSTGKLIGACDPGEVKKAGQELIAAAKKTEEATCEGYAETIAKDGGYSMPKKDFQFRCGKQAKDMANLCNQIRKNISDLAGFQQFKDNQHKAENPSDLEKQFKAASADGKPSAWALAECKIDLAKEHAKLCASPVGKKQYEIVYTYCPNETKQLVAKNCAGIFLDNDGQAPRCDHPNYEMCAYLYGGSNSIDSWGGCYNSKGQRELRSGLFQKQQRNEDEHKITKDDTPGKSNNEPDAANKAMDAGAKLLKGLGKFGF